MEQIALVLARIEGNMAKLDEQMQCIRATLSEIQGGMQAMFEADEDDEADDEATHSTTTDDGSDTDMSYIVEDHSSSSQDTGYDTGDESV